MSAKVCKGVTCVPLDAAKLPVAVTFYNIHRDGWWAVWGTPPGGFYSLEMVDLRGESVALGVGKTFLRHGDWVKNADEGQLLADTPLACNPSCWPTP